MAAFGLLCRIDYFVVSSFARPSSIGMGEQSGFINSYFFTTRPTTSKMYLGLPGTLRTFLEAKQIMAGVKKYARRGYIHVACLKQFERTPKHQIRLSPKQVLL